MIREREYHGLPGIPVLITLIAVEGLLVWLLVQTIQARNPVAITATSLALGFITLLMFGHFMVNPNESKCCNSSARTAAPPSCRACAGPIHCS